MAFISSLPILYRHKAVLKDPRTVVRAALTTADESSTSSAALPRVRAASEKLPRVDLIFNPVSGTGDPEEQLTTICSILSNGYDSVVVHETTPDIGAEELARKALADGAQIVVASGGDGTVTAVAEALRERPADAPEARLGVIPRGTANAFCAALGIPSDIESAASLINRAFSRKIDVARINDEKAMLLLCGIGLEATTIKTADRKLKNALGALAYLVAGIRSLQSQEDFRVSATLYNVKQRKVIGDGEVESDVMRLTGLQVKAVTIANAAPPASVLAQGIGELECDDGLLEFICVSPHGRLSIFATMLLMLKSALLRKRLAKTNVYGLRCTRAEITCDPPQPIVIDGEVAGNTPITLELKREPSQRQISVIAPKASVLNRRKRRLSRALIRLWRNLRGLGIMTTALYTVRAITGSRAKERENDGLHDRFEDDELL